VPAFDGDSFDADVAWELAALRAAGIRRGDRRGLTHEDFGIPVVRVIVRGTGRTDHDGPELPPRPAGRAADGRAMNEIYVFLGPTLTEKEARAELDAVYLPPAAAGDVYRLWRRRPRAIGIVDGYFERVPAVWHKEIMWVMERGVHVFGGAGLGRCARPSSTASGCTASAGSTTPQEGLDRDDEVAVRARGPPRTGTGPCPRRW